MEKFFPFLFLRSRGGGEGEEGCKEVVEEGPVESAGECAKSSAIRECGSHVEVTKRAFQLPAPLYLEGLLCIPTCIGKI